MVKAYLSLGSNMKEKIENIKKALVEIDHIPSTKITARASLYKTAPVGYTDQDWFVNTAVAVETGLSAQELLANVLDIEEKLGRVRKVRWGPRTIDIDILLYGDSIINEEDLIIPHPRMLERGFVLIPLAEISPELVFPGAIEIQQAVEKLKQDGACTEIEKMI